VQVDVSRQPIGAVHHEHHVAFERINRLPQHGPVLVGTAHGIIGKLADDHVALLLAVDAAAPRSIGFWLNAWPLVTPSAFPTALAIPRVVQIVWPVVVAVLLAEASRRSLSAPRDNLSRISMRPCCSAIVRFAKRVVIAPYSGLAHE
jgi:hypothetical protein